MNILDDYSFAVSTTPISFASKTASPPKEGNFYAHPFPSSAGEALNPPSPQEELLIPLPWRGGIFPQVKMTGVVKFPSSGGEAFSRRENDGGG